MQTAEGSLVELGRYDPKGAIREAKSPLKSTRRRA